MSDKRYLGNIITQNPTAPAGNFQGSAAKGVWSLEEQLAYQKAGLWPIPGNLPPDITDLFSTYLYTGTGSSQTITNGIDLDGEGGLVWFKTRARSSGDFYSNHFLYDSDRGLTGTDYLHSNKTDAEGASGSIGSGPSFLTNGFTTGPFSSTNETYVSWTFRKAPKFFDVVTWDGNNTAGREIAHNLGTTVGTIIVKCTSRSSTAWTIYHRSSGSGKYLEFDTGAEGNAGTAYWNATEPTSAAFTLGNDGNVNATGRSYVAYLFAHNDGDGDFGPDGSDIIKCGSYSGTGNYQEIDLGFEAQWVMIKRTDSSQDWMIFDVMRGMPDQGGTGSTPSGNDARLKPNTSDAEQSDTYGIDPHANGFAVRGNNISVNGSTYIYIAIRRGPLAPPTSATEVFAIDTASGTSPTPPLFTAGFPVDMYLYKRADISQNWRLFDRMRGDEAYLKPNDTEADEVVGDDAGQHNDLMTGIGTATFTNSNLYQWMWKRAPSYMDVVAYTGNGTAGRTVSHNLGVAPEMMWVKKRNAAGLWRVYHKGLNGGTNPEQYGINLNETSAEYDLNTLWNDTAPTSSVFTLGTQGNVNGSSSTYIAYLFATLAGISKVGSATHSGTTNVDCGFTSGARFVLLKRTDASGDWYVWDSERGIVSGNDPYLLLNSTAAEVTNTDYIDPLSSGFTITSSFTAGTYIFYAIA
jgi:hypothetical protein